MDDGHHGYFSLALELGVAATFFSATVAAVRILNAASQGRVYETASLPRLCAMLATLQVMGFAGMERLEGNAPNLIGCGIEVLTALLIAVAISFVLALVERCVIPVVATYLRRSNERFAASRRSPSAAVRPPMLLAVRTGIRRFKRPPPIFG